MKFKPGGLVQLKSGGPRMTVEKLVDSGSYRRKWFAGAKLEGAVFAGEVLRPVEDEQAK